MYIHKQSKPNSAITGKAGLKATQCRKEKFYSVIVTAVIWINACIYLDRLCISLIDEPYIRACSKLLESFCHSSKILVMTISKHKTTTMQREMIAFTLS